MIRPGDEAVEGDRHVAGGVGHRSETSHGPGRSPKADDGPRTRELRLGKPRLAGSQPYPANPWCSSHALAKAQPSADVSFVGFRRVRGASGRCGQGSCGCGRVNPRIPPRFVRMSRVVKREPARLSNIRLVAGLRGGCRRQSTGPQTAGRGGGDARAAGAASSFEPQAGPGGAGEGVGDPDAGTAGSG